MEKLLVWCGGKILWMEEQFGELEDKCLALRKGIHHPLRAAFCQGLEIVSRLQQGGGASGGCRMSGLELPNHGSERQ